MARVTLPLRHGRLDSDLPDVCIVTGEPAELKVTERFKWRPSWVVLLIFINLLIMVIVALITTKKATLELPVVDSQVGYFRTRRLMSLLFVLAGLGCLAAAVTILLVFNTPGQKPMIDPSLAAVGGAIGLLLFLIVAAIYHDRGIVPTSITESRITLKNVHPKFAQAWEDMDSEEEDEED